MPDDSLLLGQLADEFTARVRRGELPAVEDYITGHPALADRIRALFPTLLMLEGLAGAQAPRADDGADRAGDPPTLTCTMREAAGHTLRLRRERRGHGGDDYACQQ